jgi:hypothetical protein
MITRWGRSQNEGSVLVLSEFFLEYNAAHESKRMDHDGNVVTPLRIPFVTVMISVNKRRVDT